MQNPKIIIIDTSYIFYQLIWSMPELEHELKQTHIIFGFVNKILALSKKLKSKHFVFLFDSPKSKRREIFPGYKKKRRETQKEKTTEEKEMFQMGFSQLNELKEIVLPALGFKNIFSQEGYEADDIAADLCFAYHSQAEIIAVSNDEDWFQLLETCDLYNMKKDKLYTKDDFKRDYGIEPAQWVHCLAYSGCNTDEIPGIEGIGKKTAAKYIAGVMNPKTTTYKKFLTDEAKEIFDRNFPLVSLPYPGTAEFEIDLKEEFNSGSFISMCEKYGFRSLLNKDGINRWNNLFVGE